MSRPRTSSKASPRRRPAARRARAKLFVVSAPSGAGKTTLCKRLLGDGIRLADSVSMTTRAPRPGERDGVDYHFVTPARFRAVARSGGFLEYEENFGNSYGTPRAFIDESLAQGVPVLLSIDVKGAMKVRAAYRRTAVLIFIMPPSIAALKERLCKRMADSDDAIATRLALAKKEMACRSHYDHVVVNDNLEHAYRKLKKIIVNELKEPISCTRSV